MTARTNRTAESPLVRCAIYTRKSTEEGLEQAFNSLHAQCEAGEAYSASQRHADWVCLPQAYDDGAHHAHGPLAAAALACATKGSEGSLSSLQGGEGSESAPPCGIDIERRLMESRGMVRFPLDIDFG